jgi:hypothetical protein
MTYFAIALVALVALEALMLYRQQFSHMIDLRTSENEWRRERGELLARAELERHGLLDRIQHPHVYQPAMAAEYPPPPAPTDLAEMSFVGQEVPEFVHVGHDDLELVGEVIDDA